MYFWEFVNKFFHRSFVVSPFSLRPLRLPTPSRSVSSPSKRRFIRSVRFTSPSTSSNSTRIVRMDSSSPETTKVTFVKNFRRKERASNMRESRYHANRLDVNPPNDDANQGYNTRIFRVWLGRFLPMRYRDCTTSFEFRINKLPVSRSWWQHGSQICFATFV